MNLKRIKELREVLEAENISYGELHEIECAAQAAGIITEEKLEMGMLAGDMLDELEVLARASKKPGRCETMTPKANDIWETKQGNVVFIINDLTRVETGKLPPLAMLWFDDVDGDWNCSEIQERLTTRLKENAALPEFQSFVLQGIL